MLLDGNLPNPQGRRQLITICHAVRWTEDNQSPVSGFGPNRPQGCTEMYARLLSTTIKREHTCCWMEIFQTHRGDDNSSRFAMQLGGRKIISQQSVVLGPPGHRAAPKCMPGC